MKNLFSLNYHQLPQIQEPVLPDLKNVGSYIHVNAVVHTRRHMHTRVLEHLGVSPLTLLTRKEIVWGRNIETDVFWGY